MFWTLIASTASAAFRFEPRTPMSCFNVFFSRGAALFQCRTLTFCALMGCLCVVRPVAGVDFIRGDSNASGTVDLADGVYILNYLFLAGAGPSCLDSADSNDDGAIDISDAVHTLLFLFQGGAALPAPGLACGPDPTDDDGLGASPSLRAALARGSSPRQ